MDQTFPRDVLIIDAPFSGAPLNLFLIKGEGWTLVDTGVAWTPREHIFPFLKQHGIDPAELRHVVVTHGHHDHCGGNLPLYRACPNAEFLAHERDAGWAEEPLRYFNEMYLSFCPQWEPDEAYRQTVLAFLDGDSPITRRLTGDAGALDLGGGTTLTYTWLGAHTPGEVMLEAQPQSCLFVGDAIQVAGTELASGDIVFPLFTDVERYERALGLIERTACRWVCTSHQGVHTREEVLPLLQASREFARLHRTHILDVLAQADEPLQLRPLAQALHDEYYPRHELAYQIHATTYAQCQYLSKCGAVKAVPHKGHLGWVRI